MAPVEWAVRMPHQVLTEKCGPTDHLGDSRLVLLVRGSLDDLVARGLLDGHIDSDRCQLSLHLQRNSLIDRVGRNKTGEVDTDAFSSSGGKKGGGVSGIEGKLRSVMRKCPMARGQRARGGKTIVTQRGSHDSCPVHCEIQPLANLGRSQRCRVRVEDNGVLVVASVREQGNTVRI